MSDIVNNEKEDIDLYSDVEEMPQEGEIYPVKEVKIEKKSFSVFELNRKIEKGDIIVSPDFQRELRWNDAQQSELIESILMGIPIPIIYAYQATKGHLQIVDGKQRLTTLNKFLSNGSELKGLKILNELNGSCFEKLSGQYKTQLEDYQIDIYVIMSPTPEKIKYDIFDRVNRGGTKINNQEMRNALYNGVATSVINEMCNFENFKNATSNPDSKAMKDRYLALRFLSFYLLRTKKIDVDFVVPMDDFLAKVMKEINKKFKIGDFKKFLADFEMIMNEIYTKYKDNLFRFNPKQESKNKRKISMALFESLTYAFIVALENSKEFPTKENIEKFKNELDKPERITYGIDSKENIDFRFNKAMELII